MLPKAPLLVRMRWAFANWLFQGLRQEVDRQRERIALMSNLYLKDCERHVTQVVRNELLRVELDRLKLAQMEKKILEKTEGNEP